MATTYTLKFIKFKTLDSWNGLSDVIRVVHWRMDATTDGSPSTTVSAFGAATLPFPDPPGFIPHASVDVATMQGWFNGLFDDNGQPLIDSTKQLLDGMIEKQLNPTVTEEVLGTTFTDGVSV